MKERGGGGGGAGESEREREREREREGHGAAMDSLSLTTAATSCHVDTGSKSLHVCQPIAR